MGTWQQLAKPRWSEQAGQPAKPRWSQPAALCHMAMSQSCLVAIAQLLFRACITTPLAVFTIVRKCIRAALCT
jgi:hypothetical protein